MRILVYAASDEVATRLMTIVSATVPDGRISEYRAFEGFRDRLHRNHFSIDMMVVAIDSLMELHRFLEIRTLMEDLWFMLILPDREKRTFSESLLLHPRYVGFVDTDLSDVGAVLEKATRIRRFNPAYPTIDIPDESSS